MKKSLLFLPFLLLLVGAFISCEEVEEAGKYDNWRESAARLLLTR